MNTNPILIFISLCTLYACSDTFESRLSKDPIVTAVFEEEEIEHLSEIHQLFINEISSPENLDSESNTELIENYLERIRENPEARGNLYLLIKFNEEKRQNLISEFEVSGFFKELYKWDTTWWDRERMRYTGVRATDSIANIRININLDGKYPKFMSELAKKDTIIREHYKTLNLAGGLTGLHLYDMVFKYENYNLELERIQLYYALTFMNIGEPLPIFKR
ncbi:hypothetical protein ACFLTA_05235 [Bacteroidota bacterium]